MPRTITRCLERSPDDLEDHQNPGKITRCLEDAQENYLTSLALQMQPNSGLVNRSLHYIPIFHICRSLQYFQQIQISSSLHYIQISSRYLSVLNNKNSNTWRGPLQRITFGLSYTWNNPGDFRYKSGNMIYRIQESEE